MYYRVQILQPTHGRVPGEILAIKAADGHIGNVLWRKRILDEERYDVGAIRILDKTEEAPADVAVIDENGTVIPPTAPAAAPAAPAPIAPPPAPAFDPAPLLARIDVLERRKQVPDLTEAAQKIINDLIGVHDALANHEQRIIALEHSNTGQPQAASPSGSWRDILNNADGGSNIADLVSRIQNLEDKFDSPAPLPPDQQRQAAIARVNSAVRARLLDTVSGEIIYQLAMLSSNGNAKATLLLQRVRQDVAAYAGEIIAKREGGEAVGGSEWDAAVSLIIARDKWAKAVGDAADAMIDGTLQSAISEIAAIGG